VGSRTAAGAQCEKAAARCCAPGPNPIRACTKKSKRPNRIYISFVNES
jgi:hypothetical protein